MAGCVDCQHETTCLMLPDVDSKILTSFLTKVSHGLKELAVTHSSLAYLDFSLGPILKLENIDFEQEIASEVNICFLLYKLASRVFSAIF
jgi:hypothetical protein